MPPHSVCRNNRQKDSYLRRRRPVKRWVELADIGSRLPRDSGITDASLFGANKRVLTHASYARTTTLPIIIGIRPVHWKALAIAIPPSRRRMPPTVTLKCDNGLTPHDSDLRIRRSNYKVQPHSDPQFPLDSSASPR